MTPFEKALLAMLAPVAIALAAWLRAGAAKKLAATKEDKHVIRVTDMTVRQTGDKPVA